MAVIVVVDQVTKAIVRQTAAARRKPDHHPGFLDLTHVHNTGAAFGLLNATDFPYKPLVMIAHRRLSRWSPSRPTRHSSDFTSGWRGSGSALILGGAFGNLIDRAVAGYVVDFVDVYWGGTHFWAFNVADAAITVGAILVLLDMIGLGRRHASHPV